MLAMLTSFGTIRNNTALKRTPFRVRCQSCFGTIRNNTALKPKIILNGKIVCFGTIRNNTALKPMRSQPQTFNCFGTIRNNTALKLGLWTGDKQIGFGTIRNNTALKPRRKIFLTKFRNRAIRLSQTSARQAPIVTLIIPYFQGSRNGLDPAHIEENHRLFEVRQIRPLVD